MKITVVYKGNKVVMDDTNSKEPGTMRFSDQKESALDVLKGIFEQLKKEENENQ